MPEITVIADDLTGAADCGIAFALHGLPTFVAFSARGLPEAAQVVALDTDSRALSAAAAAERVESAAKRAYGSGTRQVYKKIDSTLRGHVGAEVAAVLRAALAVHERALVVAAPAFPAIGRTTRDGRVLVDGLPLEDTEVWRTSGMTGPADLAAMLRAAELRVATVRAGELRAGVDALVCDAATDDDLLRIARAAAGLQCAIVWVGSGGLARQLPSALHLTGPARPQRLPRRPGGILALVGSRSSIAREQVKTLCGEPGIECIELEPADLLRRTDLAEARRSLEEGRDAALVIGLGRVDVAEALPLAAALGRLAAPLAQRCAGVIVTGGDIARAFAAALDAQGVWLTGEVEPGVPLGFTDGMLPLVTKAGAFGDRRTLSRCRAALRST